MEDGIMVYVKIELPESFFEGEMRNGYYVSPEMKKVWAVELDLLNKFSEVCKKHGLKWFVHAGTLLGAVRHHGFIPWDDDIDVAMPRRDYDSLCKIAGTEFEEPYFLQNEASNPFFCKNFSKLINLQTTCIEEGDKLRPLKHAIFIDVFPYDNIPDDESLKAAMFEKLTDYHYKSVFYINMVDFYRPKTGRGLKKRLSYFGKYLAYKYVFRKKGDYREYMQKHWKLINSYNCCETKRVGELIIPPLGRHVWLKEWVDEVFYTPFEMLYIPVPVGFEQCLKTAFGEDWVLPKQMPNMHSRMTYDAEHSYEEYRELHPLS